jgi:hypothetical protein
MTQWGFAAKKQVPLHITGLDNSGCGTDSFMVNVYQICADTLHTVIDSIVKEGTQITFVSSNNLCDCYEFVRWEDTLGNVLSIKPTYIDTITSDVTLIAVFQKSYYNVVLSDWSNTGILLGAGSYACGDTATISAENLDTCYQFTGWFDLNGGLITTDSIYRFVVLSNKWFVANFLQDSFNLLLRASPDNAGSVVKSGKYGCGETIEITANANNGYEFLYWSDAADSVLGMDNSLLVSLICDSTIIGHFTQTQDTLPPPPQDDTSQFYLQIAVNPVNVGITGGQGYYDSGSVVQIFAMANDMECSYFLNWTDVYGKIISTDNPCNITLASDSMLIANFRTEPFYLNVTTYPLLVGKIIGNGSGLYLCKDSINMTARPTDEYYVFSCWTTQNFSDTVSRDSSLHFVIKRDTTLIAHFKTNNKIVESHNIKVSVKPNPTTDAIYLVLDLENSGNLNITLIDVLGNELLHLYDGVVAAGEFSKQISLKELPIGVYYLRIQQQDEIVLEKVIRE